jgi:hypothetical protein
MDSSAAIDGGSMLLVMSRTQQSNVSLARFLGAFVLLGTIYIIAARLVVMSSLPLWLDETWSAMIVTRADWSAFWREVWLDCNPPLYYLFLTGWVSLFGDSNFMLRFPSTLFIVAAGLLPVIRRPQGLSRTGSWTLAALTILWQPGIEVMVDARGYGLMLLLSMASCLVVVQMLDRLTLRRAAAWVAFGTMMFLTHYYAATLIAGQGLILLFRHRAGILRMWPAAFIAAPGLVWFAYHAPRLRDYARADVAWYDPTNVWSALGHLLYVLGAMNFLSFGLIIAISVAAILHNRSFSTNRTAIGFPEDGNLALAAAAGSIGFAVAIMIGLIQASLAQRYFMPLVPPAMIALTLVTQRCMRPDLAGGLLAFSLAVPALNPQITREVLDSRATYGYEESSDFIQAYKPDQLLFLWDHPASKIMEQHSLEALGGFFLKRAGHDIQVHALVAPLTADPNAILRAAAGGRRPAVIWLYDTAYQSAAGDHPPTFEKDPAWTCRHWRRKTIRSGELGSIACVRTGAGRD